MITNLVTFFAVIFATIVVVQLIIKSIDEKTNLEELVVKVNNDAENITKHVDIYLQKKTKIMLIKAVITAILITGYVKYMTDNASTSSSSSIVGGTINNISSTGNVVGGCGCSEKKTVLPF